MPFTLRSNASGSWEVVDDAAPGAVLSTNSTKQGAFDDAYRRRVAELGGSYHDQAGNRDPATNASVSHADVAAGLTVEE